MRYRTVAPILLAGLVAGASAPPASLAQSSTPPAAPPVAATPASELAERMLKAAATSDEAFLAFQHEAAPQAAGGDAALRLRQWLTTLQLHGVAEASATHADLAAFDPNLENWIWLDFDITATTPHTVVSFTVRPAGHLPPGVTPPPRLRPAALAAATRGHLEVAAKENRFSGAVLIARRGVPFLEAAYGLADRDAKTPNSTRTQFRFGSMGKMFTAVSIMQLAQAGKLDLTAPIGRYLKDYPNADIATKVTIDNLFTHTGDTGDIFTPEFFARRLELRDPKDYVALFGSRPPRFAPGARTEYSNYGFILLGRIVEAVSGQSYDDYIASHIFAPARMTATGNQPETMHPPGLAVGYTDQKGQLVPDVDTLPWRGTAAGGGYSTVGDLARFADALMADRLLDAAHTKLLTTGGFTGLDGKLPRYDFGAQAENGRRYFGHNGGAPGMNGELRIFPAELGHAAYTIVVLANRDPPAASRTANFISARLP